MSTTSLLSILQSEFPVASQEVLLDILVSCDGDISLARGLLGFSGPNQTKSKKSEKLEKLEKPDKNDTTVTIDTKEQVHFDKKNETNFFDSPVSKRQLSIANFGIWGENDRKKSKKIHKNSTSPITLYTPEDVARHLPCSLHYDVLSPKTANSLLQQLLQDQLQWKAKTKFYLFDKLCETPHKSAFYTRDESVYSKHSYRYNGQPVDTSRRYNQEMAEAAEVVQATVRACQPQKPVADWLGDACIANYYADETQSVGFHSDQLTYIGPRPVIAALSLGGERVFRLRAVGDTPNGDMPNGDTPDGDMPKEESVTPPQTYNIVLPHNSLLIMHAGCQERYKHSIIPVQAKQIGLNAIAGKSRVSLTFRHYKKTFTPDKIPHCKCFEPMILKPVFRKKTGQKSSYFWTCGQTYQGKGCGTFEWYDGPV